MKITATSYAWRYTRLSIESQAAVVELGDGVLRIDIVGMFLLCVTDVLGDMAV